MPSFPFNAEYKQVADATSRRYCWSVSGGGVAKAWPRSLLSRVVGTAACQLCTNARAQAPEHLFTTAVSIHRQFWGQYLAKCKVQIKSDALSQVISW